MDFRGGFKTVYCFCLKNISEQLSLLSEVWFLTLWNILERGFPHTVSPVKEERRWVELCLPVFIIWILNYKIFQIGNYKKITAHPGVLITQTERVSTAIAIFFTRKKMYRYSESPFPPPYAPLPPSTKGYISSSRSYVGLMPCLPELSTVLLLWKPRVGKQSPVRH